MRVLCTVVLLFFSLTGYAQNCNYQLNLGNFTASVQDIGQVLPHTLDLLLPQNSPQGPCENYRVYFAKGQANSYQRRAYSAGNSLEYNLYQSVNMGVILKDFGDAGPGEFITGYAPTKNVSYPSTFYVEVKSKNTLFAVPPGVYTDTLPLNVYAVRSNGSIQYQVSRWMTLAFNVPRYAELSIVPENAPHDPQSTVYVMDFGLMQPQQELRADLRIKANVPYGLRVSSTNGGQLRKSPSTTVVPYQLRFADGAWFAPTNSPSWLGQETSGTTISGRSYKIRVKLGNFAALDDGDYQDTLTFTVEAY